MRLPSFFTLALFLPSFALAQSITAPVDNSSVTGVYTFLASVPASTTSVLFKFSSVTSVGGSVNSFVARALQISPTEWGVQIETALYAQPLGRAWQVRVSANNGPDSPAITTNFVASPMLLIGPKGDKGDPGPMGPQGSDGITTTRIIAYNQKITEPALNLNPLTPTTIVSVTPGATLHLGLFKFSTTAPEDTTLLLLAGSGVNCSIGARELDFEYVISRPVVYVFGSIALNQNESLCAKSSNPAATVRMVGTYAIQ